MAELGELLGEKKAEQPRDDQGRYSAPPAEPKEPVAEPKAELKTEPQIQPKAEPKHDPVQPPPGFTPTAALVEERRKRQELEARLKQFEQPPKPVPNKDEDLPGYVDHRLNEVSQDAHNRFLNAVEASARNRYSDYDDKRAFFLEAAQSNPHLLVMCNQAADPAEFVYRESIKMQRLQPYNGDLAKFEADLRTSIEKELREKIAKEQTPVIPKSLNDTPSPIQTAAYQGPPALGSILRNKF